MQIYAEAESRTNFICYAEAIQYIWRAAPNIAEAESNASLLAIAEAIQYIWRQPNIAEAESNASLLAIAEAIQYIWRQPNIRRKKQDDPHGRPCTIKLCVSVRNVMCQ